MFPGKRSHFDELSESVHRTQSHAGTVIPEEPCSVLGKEGDIARLGTRPGRQLVVGIKAAGRGQLRVAANVAIYHVLRDKVLGWHRLRRRQRRNDSASKNKRQRLHRVGVVVEPAKRRRIDSQTDLRLDRLHDLLWSRGDSARQVRVGIGDAAQRSGLLRYSTVPDSPPRWKTMRASPERAELLSPEKAD